MKNSELPRHNVAVVIPTYNEKGNIAKLIGEINKLDLPIDILVVDDNSPDGTGNLVETLKKASPNVDIIHRKKKEGLGPAYITGLRHVLAKHAYDHIVQMDADFSHNPKDIPRLLEANRRYDVVIGSRYVKGGGISDKWNILRKIVSKFGNFYARFIIGLKIHDCTGGFRCYKAEALQSIDFNKRFLNGYGFLVQMAHEIDKNNFEMHKIPIFFNQRTKGLSKMNLQIILEAFFSLAWLRLRDSFGKN